MPIAIFEKRCRTIVLRLRRHDGIVQPGTLRHGEGAVGVQRDQPNHIGAYRRQNESYPCKVKRGKKQKRVRQKTASDNELSVPAEEKNRV